MQSHASRLVRIRNPQGELDRSSFHDGETCGFSVLATKNSLPSSAVLRNFSERFLHARDTCMQKPAMLAGKQQTVRSKGDNVMCTLRTLTTIGLVLVLAAGASAADKKGRSGNSHKVAPKSGSREIRGDRDVKPLKVGVAPQPGSPAAVSKLRWQSLPLGVAPKPGDRKSVV